MVVMNLVFMNWKTRITGLEYLMHVNNLDYRSQDTIARQGNEASLETQSCVIVQLPGVSTTVAS